MARNLVIVESPAKAHTIKKFLGDDFTVMASFGHVRDLPEKSFGIDIANNYSPKYEIMTGKKEIVDKLVKSKNDYDKIYLATDPDREGEAISYHLAYLLGIDPTTKCRITFNEITENAVKGALSKVCPINLDMFNAQQARRVLDRMVGYKASPLLWKKIRKGLSAGRVQSVALELVCDRENEIKAFIPAEYWNLTLKLSKINDDQIFHAKYFSTGENKERVSNQVEAEKIYNDVKNSTVIVKSVKKAQKKKYPYAPFITSTLQQDAANKLGFTTSKTMKVAQELYEGVEIKGIGSIGLISYMRTDSTRISSDFQLHTRDFIKKNFGADYIPSSLPIYKNNSNAQDAHEAIRPTDFLLTPTHIAPDLTKEQLSLYTLIYNRYIASQMSPAIMDKTTVDIEAGGHIFKACGNIVQFKGYLTIYEEHKPEEEDNDSEEYENIYLPKLSNKEQLDLKDVQKVQKFTLPPSRYTEASLVKMLEEKGIGRPSTYAPIINTVIKREYVRREKKALHPTDLGTTINDLMVRSFTKILDYGFTAKMEKDLDSIEEGKLDWISLIDGFYKDFIRQVEEADKNIVKIVVESDVICDKCGRKMVIKSGRYGDFLACPGYPACRNIKPLNQESGYKCPKCGANVLNKKTKKGIKFLSCENYPTCDFSSWGTPTGKFCPKCNTFLVKLYENKQAVVRCASEKCDYASKVIKVTKKDEDTSTDE